MTKLKLGPITQEKAVRLTIDVPAPVFADLHAYAEVMMQSAGAPVAIEPAKLIIPMITRFMATDRGFARLKRDSAN